MRRDPLPVSPGGIVIARGRFEESLREIARARELDKTSPFIRMTAAGILFQARRFDESLAEVERTLAMSAEIPIPLSHNLPRAYALANRREYALAEIARFTSRPDQHYAAAYHAALAYAALGENERRRGPVHVRLSTFVGPAGEEKFFGGSWRDLTVAARSQVR